MCLQVALDQGPRWQVWGHLALSSLCHISLGESCPCAHAPMHPCGHVPMQGGFLIGSGINYGAVLETAADIAKGMLQLHALDLVHSDLKVWTMGCGVWVPDPGF